MIILRNTEGTELLKIEAADSLRGLDLKGQRLMKADFKGHDLTGTDLEEAICTDADFSGVEACNANFVRTQFVNAVMTNMHACNANCERANFEGALVEGARKNRDTVFFKIRGEWKGEWRGCDCSHL